MTKDEALKMAIEALNEYPVSTGKLRIALEACKEALEQPACPECGGNGAGGEHEEDCSRLQPAQEPVAWIKEVEVLYMKAHKADGIMNWKTNLGLKPEPDDVPLYTHPHQWQGLTEDEIEYWECLKAPPVHPDFLEDDSWREFARCIEQALKEKNANNN